MKAFIQKFWPAIIIGFLWFMFSFPYFVKGLIPFPSDYLVSFFPPWNAEYGMPVKNNAMPDIITQIFPWKKLTIDTWKSGAIPLWNPYSFSGTTHAGNYQSAIFTPINLLFFIFPFIDAWSIMILLQPLVAAIGTYLFLKTLDRSRTSSVVGSVAFMFCGFMTTWMAYGTLGWAALCLPWALWGVVKYMKHAQAWGGGIVALSLAISFFSGHFQISLYVLFATILYILFLSWQQRQVLRGTSLFLYVVAGLCIASPQLFLALDAYKASTREVIIGKIEVIPWKYLVTLFAPDFFGNPVTRNDWFGHYAEWSSYIGVMPLLLAIFAIPKKIRDGRLFFILLGILTLLLAFPTPVNHLLYVLHIPVLSTSASSRIIVLLSFSLAVLSSYGLDDLMGLWKTGKNKPVWIFSIVLVALLALIWAMLLVGNTLPVDKLAIAKRNSVLPSIFAMSFMGLAIGGFIRKKFIKEIVLVGICVVLLFDSYRYVHKWIPYTDRQYVYPPVDSMKFLESKNTYDRVFGNIGNEASGMFRQPIIEGYDALYQGRYAKFINAATNGELTPGGRSVVVFDKHGKYKSEILKLLGVRYIYHKAADGRNSWAFPFWEYTQGTSMEVIFNDEKYQVFEYKDSYPRTFLASSYKVTTDDWDIMRTLLDPTFDARETLVLEESPIIEPMPGTGSATIASYAPTSVVIKTESQVPKLLFLSDVFDPGWHVYVDGKKSPLYRADYDFRAVALPAGEHTVEFKYLPRKLVYGFFLAIGAGILVVLSLRRKNV
jgi:hypothetical protein